MSVQEAHVVFEQSVIVLILIKVKRKQQVICNELKVVVAAGASLLMFVLFLSPAPAEDKIIWITTLLRVHSTWITTTTAFYLPERCQCLGHSSSYAMFRK